MGERGWGLEAGGSSRVAGGVFEFDADDVEGDGADVLEGVGLEGGRPGGGAGEQRWAGTAIHEDGAGGVAADAGAPGEEVEGAGPAMGVEGDGLAGGDGDVQDADGFVLEEEGVVLGGGDEGVEIVRLGMGVERHEGIIGAVGQFADDVCCRGPELEDGAEGGVECARIWRQWFVAQG